MRLKTKGYPGIRGSYSPGKKKCSTSRILPSLTPSSISTQLMQLEKKKKQRQQRARAGSHNGIVQSPVFLCFQSPPYISFDSMCYPILQKKETKIQRSWVTYPCNWVVIEFQPKTQLPLIFRMVSLLHKWREKNVKVTPLFRAFFALSSSPCCGTHTCTHFHSYKHTHTIILILRAMIPWREIKAAGWM